MGIFHGFAPLKLPVQGRGGGRKLCVWLTGVAKVNSTLTCVCEAIIIEHCDAKGCVLAQVPPRKEFFWVWEWDWANQLAPTRT